jgi:maltooligosyltrehalose trehalohydrolase
VRASHVPPALGALVEPGGVRVRVWAPLARRLALVTDDCVPPRPLERSDDGLFETLAQLAPGARYLYQVDGRRPIPDPATRFQPTGVHGPSEVIDPGAFVWSDGSWTGVPQRELVFYELHVGTFTPEGTFAAASARLPALRDLGITAIELMPCADFPGRWNWGYDQAALYAPSRAYGRPDDLRAFVDAAHGLGLAVFLDVIHNHLGPDGAYVCAYAPMHSSGHRTPWGPAINLDGPDSRGVRDFLCDSALHWLRAISSPRIRATSACCSTRAPPAATASTPCGPTTSTTRSAISPPGMPTATSRRSPAPLRPTWRQP